MSERKEPQYFCTDFWEESDKFHGRKKFFNIRTEDDYLSLFKKVKKEKIIGEATSKYMYSKVAAENIYKYNPNSKIIIMIRNPVDFLYSYHSQCIYDSVEDILDFKTALDLEESRKKSKNIPKNTPVPSYSYYYEISKFSEQMSRFKKFFPNENIRIIVYDDFKNDLKNVYKDVLHYLEVDKSFSPDFKLVNPNKKIRFVRLNIFLNNYSTLFLKYLPIKFYKMLLGFYYKLNIEYSRRPSLDDKLKLNLMKKFYSEVKLLSKILNRDLLDLWNYNNDNSEIFSKCF